GHGVEPYRPLPRRPGQHALLRGARAVQPARQLLCGAQHPDLRARHQPGRSPLRGDRHVHGVPGDAVQSRNSANHLRRCELRLAEERTEMIRIDPCGIRPVVIASVAAVLLAGCGGGESIQLSDAQTISAPTSAGAAPMFAVSEDGSQAGAWVSAPDGGSDGRLSVSVDGSAPSELRDSLGPVEPHGESPPKIAYASDGSLAALYVVAKVEPGRRFPLAALRFARSPDGGKSWEQPVTIT